MTWSAFLLFQNEVTEEATEGGRQGLIDLIMQGGPLGAIIVAILLVLSVIALYIFIERYLTIQRAAKIDQNFINNIRGSVQAGSIDGAKALCRNNDSPVARMVEKGLMRIGKPLKEIDAAIENVGNLEIFKLEKNLSTLASIAGAAPMIGFFGTVTGMIIAFYKMATEQNVTPDVLAGGIYQALITTAFGLAIGIMAFVGYNLLVSKVDKVVYNMEQTTVEFMDLLQEPVRKPVA
ncbi:MAG: MotA/TolQ/ExbB proton channel family protein [Saprospiraceae bacterium]|nr:MotA/TolQ/ExbB proton channel family protein [Saprospiraceae bacterium]